MKITAFKSDNIFASNSFLVSEDDHVLLIDNGFISDELINAIKSYHYFDGIILTHKHFDHMRAIAKTQELFEEVKVFSHLNDDDFLTDPTINCSYYMTPEDIVSFDNIKIMNLNQGKNKIGNFIIEVLFTPGHTSDSITILIDNNMFVGDLIFPQGIGRIDLPTSSYQDMINSIALIKKVLTRKKFDLYFGHGESITSDILLEINEYLY